MTGNDNHARWKKLALGPPLVTALIVSALTVAGQVQASDPPSSPSRSVVGRSQGSVIVDSRYCYNWDFQNTTDQDADDLHIELTGISAVGDVYAGPLNPFTQYTVTASAGKLTLDFGGGTVIPGDIAHIGLCSPTPLLRLATGGALPPFQWTANGAPLQPSPMFVGLQWSWQDRRNLRVQLFNDQPVTVTLMSLNLLDAGEPLSLDDLSADIANQLPMATEVITEPRTLAPGESSFFDVFFDLTLTGAHVFQPLGSPPASSQPFVLQVEVAAEDDPGNTAHLYAQGLALPLVYMPAVLRR
jgi:hypothetical protein